MTAESLPPRLRLLYNLSGATRPPAIVEVGRGDMASVHMSSASRGAAIFTADLHGGTGIGVSIRRLDGYSRLLMAHTTDLALPSVLPRLRATVADTLDGSKASVKALILAPGHQEGPSGFKVLELDDRQAIDDVFEAIHSAAPEAMVVRRTYDAGVGRVGQDAGTLLLSSAGGRKPVDFIAEGSLIDRHAAPLSLSTGIA